MLTHLYHVRESSRLAGWVLVFSMFTLYTYSIIIILHHTGPGRPFNTYSASWDPLNWAALAVNLEHLQGAVNDNNKKEEKLSILYDLYNYII